MTPDQRHFQAVLAAVLAIGALSPALSRSGPPIDAELSPSGPAVARAVPAGPFESACERKPKVKPGAPFLPLDLLTAARDDNGLALDPVWAWQTENPHPFQRGYAPVPDWPVLENPARQTSQRTTVDSRFPDCFDRYARIVGLKCDGGHRNWCPATYVGTLFWEGYESGCWKDHDYNFSLSTNSGAGLTCANNGMLGVEFDAQEVTDRAPDRWWAKLRKAVNEDVQRAGDGKPDYREARKLVDGHAAVITGLIGLDIEHTARTETHPVYAMAIETTAPDEPRALWALFARNWGNAGGCGGSQQYASFPDNHLRIRIPWRAGAASVEVAVPADPTQPPLPGDSWFATNITGSAVAPSFRIEPGKGVVVDFALPEPTEKGRFTGELHLRWVMPPSPRAIPGLTVQPAAVPRPLLPRALREHDEGLEGDLDILARDRELQRVLRSASPAALPRGSVTPSGVPGAVTSSGLGLSSLVCFCPNKSNVDQRRLPLVSDPGTPRRLLTPTRVTPRFEKEPNEERERFLSLPQVQRALKEAGARLRQRRSEQERHEH